MSEPVEYDPNAEFPGVIGRTVETSEAAWPAPNRATPGSPNVVVMLLDDVGYGQLSAFGGLANTPNIDRMADGGLRYSNFHTTALCSPTRASLLTGRNHHRLGMSAITELSLGFPAHNGTMGFEHGMISETLLDAGYNTFAVGKWHLTPPEETTTAGPFSRWPLGRGFERYYGFLGGDTDQWYPDLTYDNHPVRQPSTPDEGYHLNADMADHAIEFIQDAHVNAPDKPFFLYYCPGAGHAPHHVEPEWIEKYSGRFDSGWDQYRSEVFQRQLDLGIVEPGSELPPRDPDVPEWESLSNDERRMYARQMEVYAAFLEQTDHHFGRVLDFIETAGRLDNTIVIVMSDNGASAEGGEHGTFNETLFFNLVPETLEDNLEFYDAWGSPDTFCHYAWGWAWAGDTPFRRWKRETYRGGITDPCIIHWPEGFDSSGEVRDQYLHVVDITPTLLDLIGLETPETVRGVPQSEMDGVSFAKTLDDPNVESDRRTQFFEMFAHRSIYHEGWKATCAFPGPSFAEAAEKGRAFGMPLTEALLDELDENGWELYDLGADPNECQNLATEMPDKLSDMISLWYEEAEKNGAMPIAAAGIERLMQRRPKLTRDRRRITYYPGGSPVAFAAAPSLLNRAFSLNARVEIPTGGAEGVLLTQGSRHGGFSFYVADQRLHHVHNYLGLKSYKVSSTDALPSGQHVLRYEFEPTGEADVLAGKGAPGVSRLYVDDELVGAAEYPITTPVVMGVLGLSCGYAAFDSVEPTVYKAPSKFTGTLSGVDVDLSGDLTQHEEAELLHIMAKQ